MEKSIRAIGVDIRVMQIHIEKRSNNGVDNQAMQVYFQKGQITGKKNNRCPIELLWGGAGRAGATGKCFGILR